ncbi:MAG: C40 family peptidase [Acidobacteriia bacterium]|nr:C40 family peptidase [Terriglobia bacterium]
MRFNAKRVGALTLCGFALSASSAQPQTQAAQSSDAVTHVRREPSRRGVAPAVLSPDDGLSVIAAALDARTQATRQRDCSHLVHAIYLQAGFPYPYASSSDLYDGADDFQRVKHPQPGDLVVWPGHVGIVVNPAQRVFFSRLRSGPGVDAYDAQYWKERGQVRFYRYVKNAPAHAAATRLVSQRHK